MAVGCVLSILDFTAGVPTTVINWSFYGEMTKTRPRWIMSPTYYAFLREKGNAFDLFTIVIPRKKNSRADIFNGICSAIFFRNFLLYCPIVLSDYSKDKRSDHYYHGSTLPCNDQHRSSERYIGKLPGGSVWVVQNSVEGICNISILELRYIKKKAVFWWESTQCGRKANVVHPTGLYRRGRGFLNLANRQLRG